jgi:hypothetical protein
MGERIDKCRERAVECKRMAMLVTDETIRLLYLDLARQWLLMARDAEELERLFSHLQQGMYLEGASPPRTSLDPILDPMGGKPLKTGRHGTARGPPK